MTRGMATNTFRQRFPDGSWRLWREKLAIGNYAMEEDVEQHRWR